MSHNFSFDDEPTPDHLADTGKVAPVRGDAREGAAPGIRDTGSMRHPLAKPAAPRWQGAVGLVSLIGAVVLTGAATLLLLTPPDAGTPVGGADLGGALVAPGGTATTQSDTPAQPTSEPAVEVGGGELIASVSTLPTLSPEQMQVMLQNPLAEVVPPPSIETVRDDFNPFTIIPANRPRGEMISYEVQSGDTIFSIAERFGLEPESIAWANARNIIGGLQPGMSLNILPVNGVYHTVGEEITIAALAERYSVDPFVIIDSEFNDLFTATPETLLPSGMGVIIPGGEAEPIVWNAPVVREGEDGGDGGGGTSGGARISFGAGEPGSCGLVDNPGLTSGWVRPVAVGGYQWSRGFAPAFHTGVDLAGTQGTPIFAAASGTVIFAGLSSYGYGYAVVLAHGPYTTVYGHLYSLNVGCGQFVAAGQTIGSMGATGNASGVHLHFEIRYQDVPQDPTFTLAF